MKGITAAAIVKPSHEQAMIQTSTHDSLKEKFTVEIMTDAKHSRKIAESDLQLLANRVALLRAEEHKAINKINETKSRIKEVIEVRQRHNESIKDQFNHSLKREVARKSAHERTLIEREVSRRRLSESRKTVEDLNKLKATEKKMESRKLSELAEKFRLETEINKQKSAESVRKR